MGNDGDATGENGRGRQARDDEKATQPEYEWERGIHDEAGYIRNLVKNRDKRELLPVRRLRFLTQRTQRSQRN